MSDRPSSNALRGARRWLKWLRRDAQLFAAIQNADSQETRNKARRDWRDHGDTAPPLPGDAALKWVRKN